jgi:uncharacterized protein YbjT (DUF2867 family)
MKQTEETEQIMNSPFLVTGGTGTLGRLVVPRLRAAGRDVRVLSRSAHHPANGVDLAVGDLATGDGVDAAVKGVDTIVHLAGGAKGDDDKARTLVQAAERAGVRHLVFISVVGADRVPMATGTDRRMFGYFAAKRGAEETVARSAVPSTTLRATQFHDLMLKVLEQLARSPVIPTPTGVRFQPVDPAEVADQLVELSLGPPSGLVPDIGGPRAYALDELVRGYLAVTGRRRLLMPVRLPGAAAEAMRAGANLAPGRAVGRRTWEDFLAERLGSSSAAGTPVTSPVSRR